MFQTKSLVEEIDLSVILEKEVKISLQTINSNAKRHWNKMFGNKSDCEQPGAYVNAPTRIDAADSFNYMFPEVSYRPSSCRREKYREEQ